MSPMTLNIAFNFFKCTKNTIQQQSIMRIQIEHNTLQTLIFIFKNRIMEIKQQYDTYLRINQ